MRWHPFTHEQNKGNLPLVEWTIAPYGFQSSPGRNYDQWFWPYPVQTSSYLTYPNAFVGNQLPNFSVYVPVLANVKQSVNRPWSTHANPQQQNALQSQIGGTNFLQFGQQQSANYITSLGKQWSALTGGGKRRPFSRMGR